MSMPNRGTFVCANTDTDRFHCGTCGNDCGDGVRPCLDGVCCAATSYCNINNSNDVRDPADPAVDVNSATGAVTACVDLQSDPFHCGSCGTECEGGAGACFAGTCVGESP